MTRYARAKGSKASNERLPDEGTPWHLMKKQLEESKNKEFFEDKKSANELLRDQKDSFCSDVNVNYNWADFSENKSKFNIKQHMEPMLKENSTMLIQNSENDNIKHIKNNKIIEKFQKMENIKIEKTNNKNDKHFNKRIQCKNELDSSKEKKLDISQNNNGDPSNSNFTTMSKRQKRNRKRKLEVSNNKPKKFKADISDEKYCNKIKEGKIRNGEYKRRKPDVNITKMTINGIEIEVVKYDGFPVKKEDAERLKELKQKMIMKGIPKSEIDIAIKLERRRAEKALTRVKKQVCFNCRVSGHLLSDCPELSKEEVGTGICFKCGSTEHTHFECKVNKNSYRYAKCFICREQGHIAAQCPDNPKGIYPQGGGCKICGAVTHLKKDCPDLIQNKEDNAITVDKIDDSAVESLQKDTKIKDRSIERSKNKIIKF